MISLIIFLSIKTKQSRACACPIHAAQGHGVRGPDVHHCHPPGRRVMDGSAGGGQLTDNDKCLHCLHTNTRTLSQCCDHSEWWGMIGVRVKVGECLNVALLIWAWGRGGERRRGPAVAVTRLLRALLAAWRVWHCITPLQSGNWATLITSQTSIRT